MMTKLKRDLLPLMLGIAVLISVVLSVSLLTNPARFSSRSHEKKSNVLQTEANARGMVDVYSPTQLIKISTGKQWLLTSSSTNLALEVFKTMQHYDYERLESVTKNNQAKYQYLLNQSDALMLHYNDAIDSGILAQIFHNRQFKTMGKIKQIVIPLQKGNHNVYFLDDKKYTIYKVKVKSLKLSRIKQITSQKMNRNRIELRTVNGNPYIYFPNQIKMKDYGYMLRQQTQNAYLNRIIGNVTTASVKHQKDRTIYSSQNQDLTFDENDDVVYTNYRPSYKVKTQFEALKSAYQSATQLGLSLENTKFDTYNPKGHNVIYRFYIEGFPVYSNQQLGIYNYNFVNGNTERYTFSLRDFEVPVPTDHQNTTLPSSRTLLMDLEKSNVNMKQVSGMRLGYQVVPDTHNKLIVTLQPSWFIKYNNHWINYRYLDHQLEKGDSDEL